MKNRIFNAWVSSATTPTQTYELCPRILVNQVRTQDRGLGSGSATLFSGDSSVDKTGFTGTLLPGMWIRITRNGNDEGDGLSQGPGNIIFVGVIDTVSESIAVKNATGQHKGYITFSEIGHKFSEQVLNSAVDVTGVPINEGDVFNPIFHGKIYYNKEVQGTSFLLTRNTTHSDLLSAEYPPGIFFPSRDFAWTRYDVIQHIGNRSPFTIRFRLDRLPEQEDFTTGWLDLESYVKRSYENIDDMTLGQALDMMLPDPYSWHLDYKTSFSEITVIICSKNVSAIEGIPGGVSVSPVLDRMKDMTVVTHDSPVDELTYRGNRILFSGSFTTMNTGTINGLVNKTMDKDWTDAERDGYQSSKFFAGRTTEPFQYQANEQDRHSNYNMVYQKYKFIQPGGVPELEGSEKWTSTMYVTEMAGERDPFSKVKHFFPTIDLSNEEGVISTDTEDVSAGRKAHAQPAQFNMRMENKLGIYSENSASWYDPIVAYLSVFDSSKFWYSLINAQKIGLQEAQLSQTENGVRVTMPYPEILAKDDPEIFKDGNGVITTVPLEGWTTDHVSRYNPAEIEVINNGNWRRLLFSLAYRSDQRIEWTENRQKLISIDLNPDGETTTRNYQNLPVIKKYIVKDDDMELYFNHKGTVYDIDLSGFVNSGTAALKRLTENTISRNDFPELIKKCKQLFANLSLDRRAINLSIALDVDPEWMVLGRIVTEFKYFDGQEQVTYNVPVNTPITSIEWQIEGTDPKIIITTDIPNVPLYKKVLDAARSEK